MARRAAGAILCGAVAASLAAPAPASSQAAFSAFAAHCFSPLMTAARAAQVLPKGHDFYDLRPFRTSNPISPAKGRAVTPGTDRRCEVAAPGTHVEAAVATATAALAREGITTPADVPARFQAQPGASFVAARRLNPARIAVVQVGTRRGTNGTETFLNVERLEPLD